MPATLQSFDGLRVVALESRRADDMARLIERAGGRPSVSPSMREVPLETNRAAVEFAHRLVAGQIDVIVFLTGVGTRMLVAQIERHIERDRFLAAVSDIKSVVRGPKPLAALRELGITPTLRVPEPNTWREMLTTLDEHLPVANLVVGVQEYGVPNRSFIAGLEARGATVDSVHVYKWDLPADTGPLEENIRRIAAGEADVLMFTSANQVLNLLRLADQLNLEDELRGGVARAVVCSIGPTTSEMLRECELPVDLEASPPKMGQLVQQAAARAGELLERKREIADVLPSAGPSPSEGLGEGRASGSASDADVSQSAAPSADSPEWHDSPFLRACRREPTPHTPIWLMRQAGRYMPEYRAVRDKVGFLELCRNPQLCSEVMCTAVEYLGVDAAIIFSDLLPILEPMGMELEFAPGDGPVIHNPVRESADVARVVELESVDALHFVMETVAQTRADLPAHLPLIGFAGAPFTLASYTIEGGASRSFLHTKTLMLRDPAAWNELMARIARAVTRYLNAQIAAGCQAVQLFDSWAGCLAPEDYRRSVLPHMQAILGSIFPRVPVISFATGNPQLLPLLSEAGPEVVGVDWRIGLDAAWELAGAERAVQGNLDPMVLLAGRDEIEERARAVLAQAAGRPGHIFNLGHGVLPQTPPENARWLVEAVHAASGK